MEVTLSSILSFLALLLGFYGAWVSRASLKKKDAIDLERRLTKLEDNQVSKTDFAAMQKQVELFWTIVQKSMAELLHSPHTPEMDNLLEKLGEGNIEHDDIVRLLCLLDEESDSIRNAKDMKMMQIPTDRPRLFGIALLKAGLLARLGATEREIEK